MDLIQEAEAYYPGVKTLLKSDFSLIETDVKKPIQSDLELLSIMQYYATILYTEHDVGYSKVTVFRKTPVSEIYPYQKAIRRAKTALAYLKTNILDILKKRVEIAEMKPRVYRYGKLAGLSEVEVMIVIILVVSESSTSLMDFQSIYHLKKYLNLSYEEIFHFLNPKRIHIKENLFEYINAQTIMENQLRLGQDYRKFFCGAKLSSDESLKIHGTLIERVLNEEQKEVEDVPPEVEISIQHYEDPVEEESVSDELPENIQSPGSQLDTEDEFDSFHDFLKTQILLEKDMDMPIGEEVDLSHASEVPSPTPYTSDLDYLETMYKAVFFIINVKMLQRDIQRGMNYDEYYDDPQISMQHREMRGKEKIWTNLAAERLKLTKEQGSWLPRVERIVESRNLDAFEKNVLIAMMGYHLNPDFKYLDLHGLTVGSIIESFNEKLEDQIKSRKYFYKNAPLIKEGIIKMEERFTSDIMEAALSIDRRMIEFGMGLDTEFGELVEGSFLYMPKVKMNHVVLPEDTKKLILNTVESFSEYKKARRRVGFDEILGYGSGIAILFYGESGTGKTMMANAICNHLGKRILLINFPSLGDMASDKVLKFIFREAKINDAVLFFDECESIFESRSLGNRGVNMILTEIEKHDGLLILATNRAYDMDEAMHRRITYAVEFSKPDHILREKIWRSNIPEQMVLTDDVDFKTLAMNFELTGGYIKNAILSALSIAVARAGGEKSIKVCQEDLVRGSKLQLRGKLRMVSFDRRVVPERDIDELVLAPETMRTIQEIIDFEKARRVLFTQWGFERLMDSNKGISCLFHGIPGTGKSLAAEVIAFHTGKPLKIVNTAELVSKYVGETGKNIDSIFEEASGHDAVLVFDEAEGLFAARHESSSSSTDRYANLNVGLLLYHIENYRGIVVLCTNMFESIDPAFHRRMRFIVEFTMPSVELRERMWKSLIPSECPVGKVDYRHLASSFELSGGSIRSAVIRAAARASMRTEGRRVETVDLLRAVSEEMKKESSTYRKEMYG